MDYYEKQAKDFCDKYDVQMTKQYLKTDKYFDENDSKRDIYQITIFRNGDAYSFKFGDSLTNSQRNAQYRLAEPKKVEKPTDYTILACLQKYDVGSDVWDFAEEFGYKIDSKKEFDKVQQIYDDVVDEYENVFRLFSDCMEELQDIN